MKPVQIELKTNQTYFYCTCGKSRDKVFCDGSHKGTAFKPQEFTVTTNATYSLCACKKSAGEPFCDGSHAKINKE